MLYNISQAAQLANMHPQTLRQYDRLGLVIPKKTIGLSRRYTSRDIDNLKQVQRLSRDGVNLEGIRRILYLEEQINILRRQLDALRDDTIFLSSNDGNVTIVFEQEFSKRASRTAPIGLIEF
ncbi:MAG: MerR family transcriptional regulator [Bifidobacteriaceae bacterium]|jgi:MerR family transcriptional regulator/heat shock protein HspR|nr:MerR family transcriptional regulator [Bifidobacteriaceae bacterium]